MTQPLPPGGLVLASVTMASMRAVAGLMTALVIFAFKRDHAPLIWYGLVGVSSVVGNLSGAALAPSVRDRAPEERTVPACAILIGVAAVLATQYHAARDRPAALILATVVGIAASVAKTSFDALVQRDPPELARPRLFARFETVFQLCWVLAALVPTLLAMSLGTGFDLVAALCLGASGVTIFGWRRAKQRRLPGWWPLTTSPLATADHRHAPQPGHPPTSLAGPVGTVPDDHP